MPGLDLLLPFFAATAVFACVPGPGMFFAATQTIVRGSRAGWLAALGFHLGGVFHIAAAAFGLALVLKTVPLLFTVVKLAGAAYLVWLGIRYVIGLGGGARQAVSTGPVSGRKALRDSLVVEILNPKTALFYLAFLPQFTDPAASLPVWAQVLILGAAVNVMFSATDAICIVLSDRVASSLSGSRRVERLAQRIGGGVLIAFGVNLAVSPQ
ncbi:LysE family translocator [Microbaculum marinum]|uniref:LysE family translocator n=1 Tax=Microbaculum marinum TaxID=1764581 RepID=A0AAW9S0H0_9HYPH